MPRLRHSEESDFKKTINNTFDGYTGDYASFSVQKYVSICLLVSKVLPCYFVKDIINASRL